MRLITLATESLAALVPPFETILTVPNDIIDSLIDRCLALPSDETSISILQPRSLLSSPAYYSPGVTTRIHRCVYSLPRPSGSRSQQVLYQQYRQVNCDTYASSMIRTVF